MPQGGGGENELIEGRGHELACRHHDACQQAACRVAFLLGLLTEPGRRGARESISSVWESCVHLAVPAACGSLTEQLSCHWAQTPQAGSLL